MRARRYSRWLFAGVVWRGRLTTREACGTKLGIAEEASFQQARPYRLEA